MKKELWITYAWKDNEGGNFDYLVGELSSEVNCKYDRVELVPGQRLWEQIGDKIMNSSLDGWAILLTENSLKSEPCMEEIEYAINRAISAKANFPLIGLLHNVSFRDVPPALKTRLCIDMKNPHWKEQIIAALEKRAPKIENPTLDKFIAKSYLFDGGQSYVYEIKPRFQEVSHWRFAVPMDNQIIEFGSGSTITSTPFNFELSKVLSDVLEGTVDLNGQKHLVIGCGNRINSSVSAFIRTSEKLDSFWFGDANGPLQFPNLWYPFGVQ